MARITRQRLIINPYSAFGMSKVVPTSHRGSVFQEKTIFRQSDLRAGNFVELGDSVNLEK